MFEKLEIPTKVKTAFTREYNKMHPDKKVSGGSKKVAKEDLEQEEDLEEQEEQEEQEEDIDSIILV